MDGTKGHFNPWIMLKPDDGAGDGGQDSGSGEKADAMFSGFDKGTEGDQADDKTDDSQDDQVEADSLTEGDQVDETQQDSDSEEQDNGESLTSGAFDEDSSDGATDDQADADKPGEVKPYDWALEEGQEIDELAQEHLTRVLRDVEVDDADAPKLAKAYLELREAQVMSDIQTIEAQRNRDVEEIRNDKDLGGEGDIGTFRRTMSYVNRSLVVGEGAALNALMRQHGIDNDPTFVRFLAKVGMNFDEDVIVTTRTAAGGGELSAADAAFPATRNMKSIEQ